jgi:hypothetical protein
MEQMMKALSRLVFLGLSLLLAVPGGAVLISVGPATQTQNLGSAVSAELFVSGLNDGAAPSLGAFDIDVTYDPFILSFTGATFGDPGLGDQLDLFGLGSVTGVTPGAGSINLFEISLDSVDDLDNLQVGGFAIATLTFSGIEAGTSSLDITINALSDAIGDPLAGTTAPGAITIQRANTVSEPATLSLVALALLWIAGTRFRSFWLDASKTHSEGWIYAVKAGHNRNIH